MTQLKLDEKQLPIQHVATILLAGSADDLSARTQRIVDNAMAFPHKKLRKLVRDLFWAMMWSENIQENEALARKMLKLMSSK